MEVRGDNELAQYLMMRAVGLAKEERGLPGLGAELTGSYRHLTETSAVWKKLANAQNPQLRTYREILERMIGTRTSARDPAGTPGGEREKQRQELDTLTAELVALQGENPLMRVCVDGQTISEVISAWTGIPAGKMLKDEIATVLTLEGVLGSRVIGQGHALEQISERIRTSKASLEDPSKPIGVFMLVGPSGVGKTETALTLADLMYGGERNLITINMSEFQEAHTVSTLKGSPPGYVGYGEGGVLTEAVRRRPYSVVLLDEVEKAHPDVLELFFQVFDKGKMEDGEGREIDFKNTIIILTSNAGTDTLMKLAADPETMPSADGLGQSSQAGARQDLQARVPGPHGDHSVLPHPRRSAEEDHHAEARKDPAPADGKS